MAADERPEVSLSIPQGTLPWQVIYVRFIGFYPQNWVRGFARHSVDGRVQQEMQVMHWTQANQLTGRIRTSHTHYTTIIT